MRKKGELEVLAAPLSAAERLEALEEEINELEDKRKELMREEIEENPPDGWVKKEEADADVEEEADARREAEEAEDRWFDAIEKFGGHTPACCEGVLLGTKALSPICTCGWNEIATELERA